MTRSLLVHGTGSTLPSVWSSCKPTFVLACRCGTTQSVWHPIRLQPHTVPCGGCLQIDIAAEELRLAVACLGRITGRVDVEDLLDVVFADFCIGK